MTRRSELYRVWIETIIAFLLVVITAVYYSLQTDSTESNLKLADAQIKSGLLQSISHEDPIRRIMGLHVAQKIDEKFAAEMASILSLHDPEKIVRDNASYKLDTLINSPNQDVRKKASLGLLSYQVMDELRSKNLLHVLDEARRYYRGGNETGEKEANQIYKSVYSSLSDTSKIVINNRNSELSKLVNSDTQNDKVVRYFHAAFAEYR